jgi:hypothetical protein
MEVAFLCVIILTAFILALFVIPILFRLNLYDLSPGRSLGVILAFFTILIASTVLYFIWSYGG